MKQRVITGTLFTIVVSIFIGLAYFYPIFSLIFSLIVGTVASVEIYKALKAGKYQPSAVFMFFGGIFALGSVLAGAVLTDKYPALAFELYLVLELSLCLVAAIWPSIKNKSDTQFYDGIATAGSILYITFPLFCLVATTYIFENGWFYMVVALTAPWISDVFAYFTGVLFGKHKIVPHISPKKTWEGCIGGAIFCALAVMLYFDFVVYRIENFKMNIVVFSIIMFLFGLAISVMSQIGDWFASVIKRHVGIKDYGKFLPGHGGMLDRFDSTFYTLPVGLLIGVILFFLK
ncbi:MAG: phosphatidate cytidylyltransferase [Clostridia bacterium]|nr:phosphatidate cytidylyltransferase [Clostridia bacterium]